jgi:ribosomal protein S18 acetylase RimI-like enzyme
MRGNFTIEKGITMSEKKWYESYFTTENVAQAEQTLTALMQSEEWPSILAVFDANGEKMLIHMWDDVCDWHEAIYLTGDGFVDECGRPIADAHKIVDGFMMGRIYCSSPSNNPPRDPGRLVPAIRQHANIRARQKMTAAPEIRRQKGSLAYEFIDPRHYRINQRDLDDLTRLWSRLSSDLCQISPKVIAATIQYSHLFVVRDDDDRIQGTATLCIAPTLHGTIGSIEDVVVDASLRGRHVGKELLRQLIERAKGRGVSQIKLTSNPSRIAANALYQKLGFELRETNCYTLTL